MSTGRVHRARLRNGLQVLLKEIHTAPITSVWVWYRVGSRNERAGQTGVSHWVEHMQFKGTPSFPAGRLDRAISREGGMWNAMTYLDWTAYYATMPAGKIDLAVRLEADRMTECIYDPADVESERTVVIFASDAAGLRQAIYHLQDLCEEHEGPLLPRGNWQRSRRLTPRYIYPYFALYGDPLLDRSIDPFPAGYLDKLGRRGVDGVWIQAVLRNLAPSRIFPEFGGQWEIRLKNLRGFVQRAGAYGLKVYLYINEPRLMSRDFFARHAEVRGASYAGPPEVAQEFAMCTSIPEVRSWLSESLTHIFTQVPHVKVTAA